MMINDIETRTFGVELEMCDFDRTKINLPSGWEWDEEEKIDNTNQCVDKRYGGEINSSPLTYSQESFDLLKDVLTQMLDAGGKISWMVDIHVHIYAGDLDVEQLKKLVIFEYWTYQYFKRYSKVQTWNELIPISKPVITEKKYLEVKNATSISQLQTILSNNSLKGYVRYAINIAAYFVHKTVEFRCYKATDKFEELKNCVDGTYKMFYYAINHEESDFKAIDSYEKFVSVIGLPEPTPTPKIPLIYQGNPYRIKTTYVSNTLQFNSKRFSVLRESLLAFGCKTIAVVNAPYFDYEMSLCKDFSIIIYNEDKYRHAIYEIAVLGKRIVFKNDLEWIQQYNSDKAERQVALVLYVGGIMKALPPHNEYKRAMLSAYQLKAEDSINRLERSAERLIDVLRNAQYHYGNLEDAAKKEETIFFNFGKEKHCKRAFRLLLENSDYTTDVEMRRFSYYDFVERLPEKTKFFMFSESPTLDNMHKLSVFDDQSSDRSSAGVFLYCNKRCDMNKVKTSYSKYYSFDTQEIVPPDDLQIDDPTKLKIVRVTADYMLCLQRKYIKKVDNCSRCTWPFLVMYDKYTLGGFGFTLPSHSGYDLFQLTDFCTNNNVPRLAKLILFCIQTKQVQKQMSRIMHSLCEKVISCAYTNKPVSMKYRGVYEKVKHLSTPSYLAYEGKLGLYEDVESVVTKYQKLLKNGNK